MFEEFHPQQGIEQKIDLERVDLLYGHTRSAIMTLAVVCTLYLCWISPHHSLQALGCWYAVFTVVIVCRWMLTKRYDQHIKRGFPISPVFWLRLFRISITATGFTIGSLNVFFYPSVSPTYQMFAIIFPIAILAGTATMLPDLFSFAVYLTTLMLPVIIQLVIVGDNLHFATAIAFIVLAFFFFKFSRNFVDNFFQSMRLRYENRALVEDLEFEKNRLNNRLGRILNDSSTEIYVVAADSLNCLQVNAGAVENLGYPESDFAKINLLDIFVGLDREKFDELVEPLYEGTVETVFCSGSNRRQDFSTYPVEARLQLSTVEDPPIIIVTIQDITERSRWEDRLVYQANYDQLTGLYNRHYMQSFMDSAFVRARRAKTKVGLIFMDLDNFKSINDSLGHAAGDEVLKQTADRIREILRESDTPSRTGGDEFTVLLEGLEETSHAEIIARKLVDIFIEPFVVNGREVFTSVSIGISVYPDDGETLDQLMQYADMAMYKTKDGGRNSYSFFSQEMCRISEEQVQITNQLRNALANGELSLAYQPKINLNNGLIVGAEALLRWHNPELGQVPPIKFIHLAENMGFIESIGRWVLEAACCEAKTWQELSSHPLQVAVNVSPQQFREGTLFETVSNALQKSGLPSHLLELEITENLLLQDSDRPINVLQCLHDKGVRLALDDFGTGYSSLSYLKQFPLQVLKIDRSFISDLNTNQSSRTLVKAIVAMAHSLNLEVVAEGIEEEAQLYFLRQLEVELIQGYYFSRPIPADEFRQLLQSWTPFV